MEAGRVAAPENVHPRKKDCREKKKNRRNFWGDLFLQLILHKLREKELDEICAVPTSEREEETATFKVEFCCYQDSAVPKKVRTDTDTLELSVRSFTLVMVSEHYNSIVRAVRSISFAAENRLFQESCEIMRSYYYGNVQEVYVRELFRGYCRMKIAKSRNLGCEDRNQELYEQTTDVLKEVYEYFSRANTRCAAAINNDEGKRLITGNGLCWYGTSYYNADYYYICDRIQQHFREICEELAAACETEPLDFTEIEQNTRFAWDGGLTFHGVWQWAQMQVNAPFDQYGMKNVKMKPPEHFIYLYRNTFSKEDVTALSNVKEEMEQLLQDKGVTQNRCKQSVISGNDYHNGMSYLSRPAEETGQKQLPWEIFVNNFRLFRITGSVELLCQGSSLCLNRTSPMVAGE